MLDISSQNSTDSLCIRGVCPFQAVLPLLHFLVLLLKDHGELLSLRFISRRLRDLSLWHSSIRRLEWQPLTEVLNIAHIASTLQTLLHNTPISPL